MRRLGRWMLNAVTVISLLLCVATAVLWVRSYYVADACWLYGSRWITILTGTRGTIWLEQVRPYMGMNGPPPPGRLRYKRSDPRRGWPVPPERGSDPGVRVALRLPFVTWYATDGGPGLEPRADFARMVMHPPFREGSLRYWLLPLLFGVLPAWSAGRWLIRGRRVRPGYCHRCGYDLTGNASGVCPECGTAVLQRTT